MSYVLEGGFVLHNSQARCYTVVNKHEAISSFGSLSLFTALPFMAGTVIIGVLAKAAETHKYAEEVTFNNKFIKLFTLLQRSSEAETPRHCFKSGSFQLCNRTPCPGGGPGLPSVRGSSRHSQDCVGSSKFMRHLCQRFHCYLWAEGLIFPPKYTSAPKCSLC